MSSFSIKADQYADRALGGFLDIAIMRLTAREESVCLSIVDPLDPKASNLAGHISKTGGAMEGKDDYTVYVTADSKEGAVKLFRALQQAGIAFDAPSQTLASIQREGDKLLEMQGSAKSL